MIEADQSSSRFTYINIKIKQRGQYDFQV